ncbi:hypothetical protein TNCV_3001411 [Trichonephila clavipes]|nr:hypothetical protein TNCV_3001411 [Trichonephila clavipes]
MRRHDVATSAQTGERVFFSTLSLRSGQGGRVTDQLICAVHLIDVGRGGRERFSLLFWLEQAGGVVQAWSGPKQEERHRLVSAAFRLQQQKGRGVSEIASGS